MAGHNLWLLYEDVETYHVRTTAIDLDSSIKVRNSAELDELLNELLYTRSLAIRGDPKLPDDFPLPQLSLPPFDFAPDFFNLSNQTFVSRRFRDALAQPDDVVQYWPVDLVRGSDEAFEQDYKMFRILAGQPALDWERSDCERNEITNRRTGEQLVSLGYLRRFVPLAGLEPRSEIFRAAESRSCVLVTDPLAERVLRAGCVGASFREPETIGLMGSEPKRFRTADGISVKQDAVRRRPAKAK